MEDILQYMAETWPRRVLSGVKEVDVTACSNEAILRAVATRARAASALDLFALLRRWVKEASAIRFRTFAVSFCKPPPPAV